MRSIPDIWKTSSATMRLSTWQDAAAVIGDYPVIGAGANAFRMVFPQYRTATTRKPFEHAENEYIQMPVELGIAGSGMVVALLVCAALYWRRTLAAGGNATFSLCAAGMFTAVAVHALTDFAIRIPLYFVTVASAAGLVLSPAQPVVPEQPAAMRARWRRYLPAIAAAVIAIAVSCMGRDIYLLDSTDFLENANGRQACKALAWSPTSWRAWYQVGRSAVSLGTDESCRFGERCLTQATAYDPNNYLLWEELCQLRLSLQDTKGSREAYSNLKRLREWKQIRELEQPSPIQ
jgi:hypothetical protein